MEQATPEQQQAPVPIGIEDETLIRLILGYASLHHAFARTRDAAIEREASWQAKERAWQASIGALTTQVQDDPGAAPLTEG